MDRTELPKSKQLLDKIWSRFGKFALLSMVLATPACSTYENQPRSSGLTASTLATSSPTLARTISSKPNEAASSAAAPATAEIGRTQVVSFSPFAGSRPGPGVVVTFHTTAKCNPGSEGDGSRANAYRCFLALLTHPWAR